MLLWLLLPFIMELWRECAEWLDRLGLVPEGDPLRSTKAAKLTDLVALLRDGVVLCQLAHLLDQESVEMTRVLLDSPEPDVGRSVSDFLCRHNIFLFLHATVASFHLDTGQYFFQPEELYQCRDVGKVLETLSALSHSPKARRSGVPGFPKKEKQLAKKLKQEQRDYEVLNRLYGEAETEYLYDSFSRSAIYSGGGGGGGGGNTMINTSLPLDESHYEDIYQTIFPPKQSRLPLDISFGRKSKRAAPMQELLETEDKYLENLIMVRDVFRESLFASGAMTPSQSAVIFFRLDELVSLHSDVLFGLKQKRADVGAVFLAHMDRMAELYGAYCVNLPVAMDVLERAQAANAQLRKQVFECQTRAKPSTFPLSSHLVIPFQRFLKYHLLLKEILKHTPSDYSDHLNISKASRFIY